MRLSQWIVRACLVTSLALATVLFSGCLTSEESILGRYDAAKDEFVFLNLYQRISGEKAADNEYLYGLWQNRDHLITPPFLAIFTKPSFLRLSATQFAAINLGESKSFEAVASPVPLDAITVKPGKFFSRGDDALCYYDQVIVPGKTVDLVLDEALKEARKSITGAVGAEVDRRKNGGKVWTWDDYRKLRRREIRGEEAEKPADAKPGDEAPDDVLQYVSSATLEALTKGINDGTATVIRKGPVFTLYLPGSEEDVKTVVAIVKELREESNALVKKGTAASGVVIATKLTDPIDVQAAAPTRLAASIDVTQLFKAMDAVQHPAAALPPAVDENAKRATATLASIRAKGVAIDDKLTVDQILAEFKDGSLPANASEKRVKPGEGLVISTKSEEVEVKPN